MSAMRAVSLIVFLLSLASAFVSRVRSQTNPYVLFAGGFSRGPSGGESLPVGYNRKPKPKPNAQRPSVRPTKAPKAAAVSSSNQALIGRVAQDVDPASPCGCGSGSAYSKCCGVQHMSFESSNTPEQVLRARYTAFKYGLADYIIDSTHTSNEDFQKFMVAARATKRSGAERWKREILQLKEKEDLGFLGIDVVSTEVIGDFATVIFRALFLQGASAVTDAGGAEEEEGEDGFLAVEEKSLFERTGAGKWLYKDGETTAPEADIANAMIDKWASSSDKAGQPAAAEEAGGSRRRSAAKQAYLDSLPAQVAGAGGKADGLVREGASAPRAPWLDGTAKRKQSSGGLNDKSPIRPFASGRA